MEDRELKQARSKPDTIDRLVRTARIFVHQGTTCANLHQNRFIHFHVTDERTNRQTDRKLHGSCQWSRHKNAHENEWIKHSYLVFRETMLSKVVCHVRNVRAERTCKIFLARMNQHVNLTNRQSKHM